MSTDPHSADAPACLRVARGAPREAAPSRSTSIMEDVTRSSSASSSASAPSVNGARASPKAHAALGHSPHEAPPGLVDISADPAFMLPGSPRAAVPGSPRAAMPGSPRVTMPGSPSRAAISSAAAELAKAALRSRQPSLRAENSTGSLGGDESRGPSRDGRCAPAGCWKGRCRHVISARSASSTPIAEAAPKSRRSHPVMMPLCWPLLLLPDAAPSASAADAAADAAADVAAAACRGRSVLMGNEVILSPAPSTRAPSERSWDGTKSPVRCAAAIEGCIWLNRGPVRCA